MSHSYNPNNARMDKLAKSPDLGSGFCRFESYYGYKEFPISSAG